VEAQPDQPQGCAFIESERKSLRPRGHESLPNPFFLPLLPAVAGISQDFQACAQPPSPAADSSDVRKKRDVRRKRPILGDAAWTPRERVVLFCAILSNDDWVPDAAEMLSDLRRLISHEECQPEPVGREWDWRD